MNQSEQVVNETGRSPWGEDLFRQQDVTIRLSGRGAGLVGKTIAQGDFPLTRSIEHWPDRVGIYVRLGSSNAAMRTSAAY